MSRRGPENHCHNEIDAGDGNQQGLCINIGIEHPAGAGDALPRQQSQRQNRPSQSAGYPEGQQCQPQEMPLPAEGHQRQQRPRRDFHR